MVWLLSDQGRWGFEGRREKEGLLGGKSGRGLVWVILIV